jgi:uncharacterized linocin/CFP29 family protein
MDNLHRELAPISDAAWSDLEDEARRTFRRHVAARRVVDVTEAGGIELAAVGTGHLQAIESGEEGIVAGLRLSQPIVELRAPFTVDRAQVDAVERGAKDADWQPVKDAARRIAFAEDRAVFAGYADGGITGIRDGSSQPAIPLPAATSDYPAAITQAVTALRLAGVDGPYALALGPAAWVAVNGASDEGYPIRDHIGHIVDGEIVWAPALDGAFLLSTRGGDFELRLGQDLSIGYLAHDATTIELYFQETLTFQVHTGEAAICLPSPSPA